MQLRVPYNEQGIGVFQKALEVECDRVLLMHGGVYWHGGHGERRYFEGGKVGFQENTQERDGHSHEAGDDHGAGEVEEVQVEVTVGCRHGEFVTVAMKIRMRSTETLLIC